MALFYLGLLQGPRIKLVLVFLGGIDRDKGRANDAMDIRRFQEGIHGKVVLAYPGFRQQVLCRLA
jgi:hypothetical protein